MDKVMNQSVLDFRVMTGLTADASNVQHTVLYVDFLVNGSSLYEMIKKSHYDNMGLMGCFARDWDALNTHSKKQFLLEEKAETEAGRCLLYVCPECADLKCGAFACRVTKTNHYYARSDFAYENGYEDAQLIESVGPFNFAVDNYEKLINQAYLI
jgi:hypothetical protein